MHDRPSSSHWLARIPPVLRAGVERKVFEEKRALWLFCLQTPYKVNSLVSLKSVSRAMKSVIF